MNTENILNFLKSAGLDLLRGILVLVVGFFLVHWINKLLLRGEKLKSIDPTLGVLSSCSTVKCRAHGLLTPCNCAATMSFM